MFRASSTNRLKDLSSPAEQIEQTKIRFVSVGGAVDSGLRNGKPAGGGYCEPREFNVLEEFILRAGVEFESCANFKKEQGFAGVRRDFKRLRRRLLAGKAGGG